MIDITPPSVIDLPSPKDAAQNIQDANGLGLHPDHFVDIKDLLKPTLDQAKSTNTTTPVVAAYAAKSLQHLALIKGDAGGVDSGGIVGSKEASLDGPTAAGDPVKHASMEDHFNFIAGQVKHGWQGDTTTTDMVMDKIFGGSTWNSDKEIKLQVQKLKDGQAQPSDFGLTPNEQIFGHALGGIAGMAKTLWEDKFPIIAATAAGAVVGGGAGAGKAASWAINGAFAVDTFKHTTASVYNDLSDAKDPTGKDIGIDENTKKYTAIGVGALNSAIQFATGSIIARGLPGAAKVIAPDSVKAIMTDPLLAPIRSTLFKVGEAVASGFAMGFSQGAVQTFAESFAKNYKGPDSMQNALIAAADDTKTALPQLARQGVEGALMTGVVAGTLHAGAAVIKGVRGAPPALERPPEPMAPKFPLMRPEEAKAQVAINVGDALDRINKISMTTKIAEHAPLELATLQKSMSDAAGIKNVFLDPEELQTWAEKGGRAAAARSWIGGKTALNGPVSVPMHSFLGLVREFPDAIGLAKVDPEAPSVNEAKGILKNREKGEQLPPAESDQKSEEAKAQVRANRMDEVRDPMEEIKKSSHAVDAFNETVENPNLEIVDHFQALPETKGLVSHDKSGFSAVAIDPAFLPPELKGFAKDKQLQEHGTFVKGGIGPDDAAEMLGIKDGETLLKLLSATPTREQAAQTAAERQNVIQSEASSSSNFEELPVVQDYSKSTKGHLAEMKVLKDQRHEIVKGESPVRISERVPSYGEITAQAKAQVNETKVGDLNANVHQVGERNSQAIAEKSLKEGEIFKAFNAKEAAARNSELAKHTQIAIGKVNKVVDLVTRFTPDVMEQLKAEGKEYANAVTELLGKFNLDLSKVEDIKEGSVEKYVNKQVEAGGIVGSTTNPGAEIPRNFQEMTVSQVLAVGDTLRNILKNSEVKDLILNPTEGAPSTISGVAAQLTALGQDHPLYDASKIGGQAEKPDGTGYKIQRIFAEGTNMIQQVQHLLVDLGRGKVLSPWTKEIFTRVENAQFNDDKLNLETKAHNEKAVESFGGEKKFQKMYTRKITVPELKSNPYFKGGKISEMGLFVWELNWGNEGNLKVWDEYGISRELGRSILDKYLSDKHTMMAQDFRNVFASFHDKAQDLQMRTEGTTFEPVQAQPYVARGKEVPGGYYPIFRQNVETESLRRAMVGAAEMKNLDGLRQNFAAQALTEQGHTITREGGEGLLDLDIHRYGFALNQLIHDLTMREAIRDTAKILAHPDVADTITAVHGPEGYRNISQWLIDVANKVDRNGYNKTASNVEKLVKFFGNNARTVLVAFKLSSALVAPKSLFGAAEHMGAKGPAYISLTIAKMGRFDITNEVFKFAQEIDPTISNITDGIANKTSKSLVEMVPDKKDLLKTGADYVTTVGMSAVGSLHALSKAIAVTAAYNQAINGHAEGVEGNNHKIAVDYARSISALTQTHYEELYASPLQKNKVMKAMLLYFFNDANNSNNNTILAARLAKARFAESGDLKDKNAYLKASKAAAQGVGGIMTHTLGVVMLGALYASVIRKGANVLTNKISGNEQNDSDEDPQEIVPYLTKLTLDDALGGVPVLRDLLHSAFTPDREYKGKTFETPYLQAFNSFATSISGLTHYLGFREGDVTPEEAKSYLYSAGFLGAPFSDALYKYMGSPDMTDLDLNLPKIRIGSLFKLNTAIAGILEKNETKEEEYPPEFIEALKKAKLDLAPAVQKLPPPTTQAAALEKVGAVPAGAVRKSSGTGIPKDYYDRVAHVESRNDPDAMNDKSSATGLFQMTQGTLDGIRDIHPELKLPKDVEELTPDEQKKSMAALTVDNAKKLKSAGIPLTTPNLYFAHVLGISKAIEALKADDGAKLRTISGSKELANNWQAFSGTKKQGDHGRTVRTLTVWEAKQGILKWLGYQ